MKKVYFLLIIFVVFSCRNQVSDDGKHVLTVSISPFKYFVEAIADDDFTVNVMVPSGANAHIYEPYPEQIIRLRSSVAYISNGYLDFEKIWLDRFFESNKAMKILSLGDKIEPLVSDHHHEGDHDNAVDPHYWVSPKCALRMALEVKDFLCELNPSENLKYETNYKALVSDIKELDNLAEELFSNISDNSFMIFHPNLGYFARDYGLEQITVENEGKEPSPAEMKNLIDRGRSERLKTVFVQREYDTRNAATIAEAIGAQVVIIDPLSEDWLKSTKDIILAMHSGFMESSK
jgi:zinc transport system substrate-binding protein